ncbi:MFS transporter [Acetobacteraceae bacterium KSS8]|uniref:MFS transporter n=1 Tax=Endosaccharibacter trunci TaxID=2812733 RepID=A0ABT1W6L9_9PROT|nr:MFS transporter [Acetobacteraceae bacterium KSS8]
MATGRRYHPASLDALNFTLADVRGALGPFLIVYLTSFHGWTQREVGVMGAITGIAGVILQTPAGALIDRTTARRGVIVGAVSVLIAGSLVMWWTASFWPVVISNGLVSVVSDVFAPAVTALTLGLTARRVLARRIGRNNAFDHAGNIVIALTVGAVGTMISERAVFLLVPIVGLLAILATLSIPAEAVDQRRARGMDRDEGQGGGESGDGDAATGILKLLRCRPLLVLCASAFMFHLANAAMLPLVGQELAETHKKLADGMMSICIIAAQGVMLPLAILCGRKADDWGRRRIFLAGFAILPIRGVLYTFSHAAPWLIGVQILDGVGAGIYGAIVPLMIADLTRGTGRFNLAQGLVATTMGVGASLSPLLAGLVHDGFRSYEAAWFALAIAAALGFCLFLTMMPETMRADGESKPDGETVAA